MECSWCAPALGHSVSGGCPLYPYPLLLPQPTHSDPTVIASHLSVVRASPSSLRVIANVYGKHALDTHTQNATHSHAYKIYEYFSIHFRLVHWAVRTAMGAPHTRVVFLLAPSSLGFINGDSFRFYTR